MGDCGLTGRKIIVDTYGGFAAPRRRRVFRQGSVQGRPVGRVCRALRCQEHRCRGPGRALRGAGLLRDRRRGAHFDHGRDLRDRQAAGQAPDADRARAFRSDAVRAAGDAGSGAADLSEDRLLRPFRPQGGGVQLGAHRQGGSCSPRNSKRRAPPRAAAPVVHRYVKESSHERSNQATSPISSSRT